MTPEFFTALELIGRLDAEFPGTSSLIVGGAVRDRLFGIEAHDVDIATNVPFDQLASRFNMNDITKNTVNAQPVSIITFNGFSFEIAAFRSDVSGIEGRANNIAVIVDTFEEDSARRDITINAMGIDSNDRVVDPQDGRLDLMNELVRAVGNPFERFREDATRILRVFRFAAKFNFGIEIGTLTAAVANKFRLLNRDEISPESIAKEIFKAANDGPTLMRFLMLLDDATILEDILPEFTALEGFTHDPQWHPEWNGNVIGHIYECLRSSRSADPVVNIGILLHDLGKAVTRGEKDNGHSNYHGHEDAGVPIAQAIFDRLRFPDLSAEDKDAILFAVARHMLVHNLDLLAPKTMAKLVLNPAWEVLKDVSFADEASRHVNGFDPNPFNEKIARVEERVSRIAVSADDLRLKVKAFVDGNVLQDWFPEIKRDLKVLKPLLALLAEFILDRLDQGNPPSEAEIRLKAAAYLFDNFNI
jgi:tRNA nucleotidyltransferase/poly(A) polymerase